MKLLQVYHIYPMLFGGVSTAVYQLTKELSKRGHQVDVLTTNAHFDCEKKCEDESGINVYRFKLFSKRLSKQNIMIPNTEFILWAKRMMRSYNCIHLHGYRSPYNIVVYHYAMTYGVPYVLQARGSLPRIMAKQRLKWIFDVLFGYRLLRDASKVVALSQVEAEQYKAMGVPEGKIAIIPNGIDLAEYANLPPKGAFRKKFSIDDNEKIVLYLGRIHRIKGIDVLLKAFSHIAKTLEDAKLAVVGPDDGYLSVCKDLTKRLNLEGKVLFTGSLYGKAKLEAYVDADVFALPSRYEIFGNVILESYACYKPVVATRVGGLQEIVFDGETGLLVKPSDVKELSSAIFTLLNDDKTRISMGMYARRVVEEKFSLEKVVDKLEAVYGEVLRR